MEDKKQLCEMNLEEIEVSKQESIDWFKVQGREIPHYILNQFLIMTKLEEARILAEETIRFIYSERQNINEKVEQIKKVMLKSQ